MGNMWTGQFTFVSGFGAEYDAGNAEFQSGVVKGNDLYDESGYVKIGYVQGRTLTTTVGGQYLTLEKDKGSIRAVVCTADPQGLTIGQADHLVRRHPRLRAASILDLDLPRTQIGQLPQADIRQMRSYCN